MGLFGFGRAKPRTPEQIVPHVDLSRGIVCELGRKDTRETIERRLGTPTKTEKTGLLYDQIGLRFNVEKTGRITGWSIFFTPEILPHWTWGDRRTTAPREIDVLALLGAPVSIRWSAGADPGLSALFFAVPTTIVGSATACLIPKQYGPTTTPAKCSPPGNERRSHLPHSRASMALV